jgi:integrase
MQAKITAKIVAKMKPGDAISDIEIRGFSARCWDTGAITYSLRYRTRNGDRKRFLIGTHGNVTPDEARKIAKQRAGEVAGGLDPVAQKKTAEAVAGNTVSVVWDEYAKRELAKKRSAKHQMNAFDRLVRRRIGDRSIYELRRADMVKLLDVIEDNQGPVMADRMLSYLARAFRWQQVRDEDFISPIISGMSRTKAKELARERVLTDDELRAIWKATEQGKFGALIHFLLLTAARRSEAAEMTRSELDGATWTLPASRNKTKTELVRPLSKAALAILTALPGNGGYVFKPMTGFTARKAKLDSASGVTDWTIHDLRRTARSLMSRAGVPSDHAEMCLGHILTGVRGVYDRHEYYSEKAAAFERLAALIAQIVDPQPNVMALRG